MPSAPSVPAGRQSAQAPAGRREYESYDQYEAGSVLTGAGTAFVEVVTFSGRPDSILISSDGGLIDVRFRNRGGAPFSTMRLGSGGTHPINVRAEIVEGREATGAGGLTITAIGRWASGGIDVRANRPGPSRERPTLPEERRATQVLTSE